MANYFDFDTKFLALVLCTQCTLMFLKEWREEFQTVVEASVIRKISSTKHLQKTSKTQNKWRPDVVSEWWCQHNLLIQELWVNNTSVNNKNHFSFLHLGRQHNDIHQTKNELGLILFKTYTTT